jgi:hypothetical protein
LTGPDTNFLNFFRVLRSADQLPAMLISTSAFEALAEIGISADLIFFLCGDALRQISICR